MELNDHLQNMRQITKNIIQNLLKKNKLKIDDDLFFLYNIYSITNIKI